MINESNNIAVAEAIDERQTDKWNYEVEQVPLFTPTGEQTRFFGNRRKDNGEVLGVVTDKYEVLQNGTMFETTEELFRKKGMNTFKRKEVVTHGGARVRAIYDFPDMGVKMNGQDLTFRLKVQNSFDGSLRASFAVGLFRLICSNGMAVPVNAIGMTKKHTQSLDVDFLGRGFDSAVRTFHESIPVLAKLIETPVSQTDGVRILDGLVARKVLSDRMSDGIKGVWENPTHHEDRDRNLWNLYNATTQHLTHSVEGRRFELAERVNSGVLGAFTRAVRNGGVESLMVTLN